ncbi:tyrosine-type recombinase/integrase [Aureimonas sp. N4]|uniref:tyrosine-type recombinase/integrase n=1 Tax=Aureimonas sp. N4 TaxID=1638165 RepID=UPI000785D730|nr:tyrosine-type recombinase/integrase [Aureimonas sp. N4]
MSEDHPGAGKYRDRHEKERWRFRRGGKTIALPGAPGDPEFEEAYRAAVEGRKPVKAEVRTHPNAALPRTFGAAWRLVKQSADWKRLEPATQHNNTRWTEAFLLTPVLEGHPDLWKDQRVEDFKRRHMKALLSDKADTPHAARNQMVAIRRMMTVALDEEWIDFDPTLAMKWRPEYKGRRAWTDEEMEKFEKRWPIGSNPRLVYAIALWLGNRRSDVTRLRWDQRKTLTFRDKGESVSIDAFVLEQKKTGKQLTIPIVPMLSEVLDGSTIRGETVIVTAHGNPYSDKSLTGRMRTWTRSAKLPEGCTLHGLRKTLGRILAESDASTRQIMDILGHDDIEHAELYSREAAQIRLAMEGMNKVVALRRRAG